MTHTRRTGISQRRHAAGLTLIEMMIAMVLGLMLVLGVISVVAANSQAYRTNEGLSQVQEGARTGFEMLARRLREAGITGCGNTVPITNTVNDAGLWWQEDWTAIRAYDGETAAPGLDFGTNAGERIDGTAAILLQGLFDTGLSVEQHGPGANFKINAATTDIVDGDILMVCDFVQASILQVSNYNSANVTVVHNTGNSTSPGNCTVDLGLATRDCETGGFADYRYGPNSMIARLATELWYIGANGRPDEGGRSLFRRRLGAGGITVTDELVPGLSNMQMAFRSENDDTFEDAAPFWELVNAIQITLDVTSTDIGVSTAGNVNQGRLTRSFTNVVGLRNRIP